MIGKTISHFKILEKLGEGGMGVVYKAEDIELTRFVALKFLSKKLTKSEKTCQRFRNEARAVSPIDHPNICTVHELKEAEDGQLYFVMGYCGGETLQQKIDNKTLKLKKVLLYAIQTAQGISEAHSHGIIHRDIKPANLMVTKKDVVKILDFGIAKVGRLGMDTREGAVFGSLGYMSPEQSTGVPVDHRTDIWSLGVVLYEALTGRTPFEGEHEGTILNGILNEQPIAMSELVTGIPRELERIVNRALDKNKEERYQHMDEMLVDLRALNLKLRKDSGFSTEKVESLAVMPFSNASGREEIEYLSEGLTESLITSLSHISNFKVISRTSAFHYKGQHIEIQKVTHELKVNKLLLGWVSQRSDNISIGVELVEGRDNSQIWGEQYTRKLTDMIQIQEEIVKDISAKLKLKLTKKEKKHISKQYEIDDEAYQLFLKGRFHWNKRTVDSFRQSIYFYNQAIERDPAYALAYAGLSDSYALIGIYGHLPAKDVWPKAMAAALKAMEIDSEMAEAHNALGAVESSYKWNWAKAEKEFQHSIALKPNYATAHQWYAGQLRILGKFDEALRETRKALEIDPLSLQISTDVGRLHYYSREYDLAIQEYQKILQLDSSFFPAHFWLGLALLEKRDFDLAVEALRTALTLSGNYVAVTAALGYAFGISGNRTEAQKIMKELKSRARNEYISAAYFGWVHMSLNELDAAFQYFDKAFEERSWWLVHMKIWPSPEEFVKDARHTKLLKRIGLPV